MGVTLSPCLPPELWLEIFSYLETKELAAAVQVLRCTVGPVTAAVHLCRCTGVLVYSCCTGLYVYWCIHNQLVYFYTAVVHCTVYSYTIAV